MASLLSEARRVNTLSELSFSRDVMRSIKEIPRTKSNMRLVRFSELAPKIQEEPLEQSEPSEETPRPSRIRRVASRLRHPLGTRTKS